ncbi:putative major pilin subunit [Anaerohalosphaera lusitana]|uniref:Putative major pilin subunit n=1 Tax=Anaerohalosphaera lusitana TaxID=1936003 RepID=A0A1U9NM12_9BACT|nr:prepilin-type N-terminal cleavage/methylation domain-containing protein [Anaerohalosphaera lusitana]AQT68526.1 putative major pilin subunit [Anaerohalosphaera lusitana]
MARKQRKIGYTLTELLVVIAIIAVLVAIGVPAVKSIQESFNSGSNVKTVISKALGNARAIALKEQTYAGVRFQRARDGRQYMVLVIYDPGATELDANGFRAVPGRKPNKLPEQVLVLDGYSNIVREKKGFKVVVKEEHRGGDNEAFDENVELNETSTFSVVFGPSGRLIARSVRVRNREGIPNTESNDQLSDDKIFNKKAAVESGAALFYQDGYCLTGADYSPDLGYGPETSRKSFIVCDRLAFEKVPPTMRWTRYLRNAENVYINSYTGEVVNK